MLTFRNLNGIALVIDIYSESKGEKWEIPLTKTEGWSHISYKVSLALHLRLWGYKRENIMFEHSRNFGSVKYRGDVVALGHDKLPNFWFECQTVENEKLIDLAENLKDYRVVHVDSDLGHIWNYVYDDEYNEITEPTEKERWDHRRRAIPKETEYWSINADMPTGRLSNAVKHDSKGEFIFLDTDENYSIRSLVDFHRKLTRMEPLIEGVVGSHKWDGRNRIEEIKHQEIKKQNSSYPN